MKHHNKTRRLVVPAIVLTVCFSLIAAMSMAQAYAAEKTMKCSEPSQAQQMCPPKSPPATCEAGTCKVTIDCPALKNPGITTCQATIDCPAKPAKPEKEQGKK
jgi:hypothetical protein